MNPKNLTPTMADTSDPFLKDILASAAQNQPPPAAKHATLVALGLAVAVPVAVAATASVAQAATASATTATTGATAATKVAATTGSTAATKAAVVSSVGAGKWVLGGLALFALVSGVAYGVRTNSSDASDRAAAPPAPPRVSVISTNASSQGVVATAQSDIEILPNPVVPAAPGNLAAKPALPNAAPLARPAVEPAPLASAAQGAAAPGASTLARETAILSEVREALSAGDTATARARLHAYDVEFSNGMLRREASVLRDRLPAP